MVRVQREKIRSGRRGIRRLKARLGPECCIIKRVHMCPILSSTQRVTKRLQDPKIDLIQASDDLDGPNRIIDLKSEDITKNAVRSASEYCEKCNVPLAKVSRRKMIPGENVKDDGLSAIEEMKIIMNKIANRLKSELSERSGRDRRLADKFSILVNLDSIDVEKIEHLNTLKQ